MRNLYTIIPVSVLALLMAACIDIGETEAAGKVEKPNVLFIAVDDLND